MLKNVKVLIQICFIRYNGYIFVHIINNNNLKITKMTTIKNILNPRQRRIILISFAWNPTGQYITDIKDLPQVLKELDPGKGIEFIKEFDNTTLKFKRVSKKTILSSTWNAEELEILKLHPYFL